MAPRPDRPARRLLSGRGDLVAGGVRLRPLTADDTSALHALWTDAAVRRFLWDDRVIPPEETRAIVERSRRMFETDACGLWGVRAPDDETLIAFAGFWHFREPPALELLFGVAHAHWSRGIATACSRRLIAYGFDVLGLDVVDASTDVANAASARVLEKAGMMLHRRAVVDGLDTLFFRIARPAAGG